MLVLTTLTEMLERYVQKLFIALKSLTRVFSAEIKHKYSNILMPQFSCCGNKLVSM